MHLEQVIEDIMIKKSYLEKKESFDQKTEDLLYKERKSSH